VASRASTVEYLLEQMQGAGTVSARRMFGEYAIYCDGRMVALVCDDQLFVKPTVAGRAFIGAVTEAPPYRVARPWFLICGDKWDDRDWLGQLVRISAAELPLPLKKSGTPKKRTMPRRQA
jgi:TfoX/Sxy family transcriptional regulator of competence genes